MCGGDGGDGVEDDDDDDDDEADEEDLELIITCWPLRNRALSAIDGNWLILSHFLLSVFTNSLLRTSNTF